MSSMSKSLISHVQTTYVLRDGTIPCFFEPIHFALKVQLCSKEATLVWLTIGNGNVSFLCLAVTLRFFRTCAAAALLM